MPAKRKKRKAKEPETVFYDIKIREGGLQICL